MYGVLTYHSACAYEMLEELRVTALKPTTLHGHGHAEQMHANLPGGDFPMGGPCFHVSTLDSRDAVFEETQSLKASKAPFFCSTLGVSGRICSSIAYSQYDSIDSTLPRMYGHISPVSPV